VADIPDFLETFEGAVQSACWFWETNNLNATADVMDIKKQTKIINGGYLGLDERIAHIKHAVQVLGA
jgi:putative chitinase